MNEDGKVTETTYMDMNATIDHRYLDGANGAKVTSEVIYFIKI
jgi:hypothetical protein